MNEKQLSQALRDAEKAHAVYEKTLGHKDDNWPDFYAHYIVTNITDTDTDTLANILQDFPELASYLPKS